MKTKILFILTLFCLPLTAFTQVQDLNALLGGSVQSDKWLINREKEQEEFIGNVRYQNDIYNSLVDWLITLIVIITHSATVFWFN